MLIRDPVERQRSGRTGHRLLNLSVYGEWRSSLMGMAGRDPVFFAQLESEINTYPGQAGPIQDLCLSCHGAMGQRQYQEDRVKPENQHKAAFGKPWFDISMVFATEGPYARYGALARDGISCMTCHQMSPGSINVPPEKLPDTGRFIRAQDHSRIYGSTPDHEQPSGGIRPYPMEQALGLTPVYDPYVNSANLCGTCHVIQLKVNHPETMGHFHGHQPMDKKGRVMMSKAHEQDTYLEWLYSGYQNANPEVPVNRATAMTCQQCHMPKDLKGSGLPLAPRVANVENGNWPSPPAVNLAPLDRITVPPRPEVGRHSFFGMNLFTLTFYQQFTQSVFGIAPDSNVPEGTVSGQDFAVEDGEYQIQHATARVDILETRVSSKALITRVRVSNRAGHRFPSGVGFRRAWMELTVLGKGGEVLWGSGVSDSQGVIQDGAGQDAQPLSSEFTLDWQLLQPHWNTISRQNQVQIYEERYVNINVKTAPEAAKERYQLSTSFLGIGRVIKDNRLLPRGYQYRLIKEKYKRARGLYRETPIAANEHEMEKWESLLPVSLWGETHLKAWPESLKAELPEGAGSPADDPAYRDGSGSDELTYIIPLEEINGAREVRVQLNYQNLPPYYLRDRFQLGKGGGQTQRLYYLVGHTKTAGTLIEGWKIKVASDRASIPREPDRE